MRTIISIMALLLYCMAIAQNRPYEILLQEDPSFYTNTNQVDNSGQKNGYWCVEKDGQRYYSFYKNGKRNGLFRQYERVGKLWRMLAVGVYKDDDPVGPLYYFDENGIREIRVGDETITNIKVLTDLRNKKDGYLCDEYYSSEHGCMIRSECFYNNGAQNGIELYFREVNEGQWVLLNAGMYKDNLYVGQWQYFYDNGMLHEVVDFPQRNTPNVKKSALERRCPVVRYRENGQKSAEGWYLDPEENSLLFKLVDDWTYFFPDGEILHIHY